jgi:redox-sensitive bicupin YhaK (pirin superfamily)
MAVPDFVIAPRTRDLGDGFMVKRVLPAAERRTVGPFVFFDHFGPLTLKPGKGMDVRPHPHIGLSTLSYLFDGEILHRDSLGTVRIIRPGEVNWMTAGKGIVHSERTPDGARRAGSSLHGIQSWLALPEKDQEVAPSFVHCGTSDLPTVNAPGARLRVVAGDFHGAQSPVPMFSETFYGDLAMDAGGRFTLPPIHEERAIYIAAGTIGIDGTKFEAGHMLVFLKDDTVTIETTKASRLILLGGAPLDGPRHIWWNFVSSSKDRIEQAKTDWKEGKFGSVPGETEFIPLPE